MDILIFTDINNNINLVPKKDFNNVLYQFTDTITQIFNPSEFQKKIYSFVKEKFGLNMIFTDNDITSDDLVEGIYLLNNKYLVNKINNKNNWGSKIYTIIELGHFDILLYDSFNNNSELFKNIDGDIITNIKNNLNNIYINLINNPDRSNVISSLNTLINLVPEVKGKLLKSYVINAIYIINLNYIHLIRNEKFTNTSYDKLKEYQEDVVVEHYKIFNPNIIKLLYEKNVIGSNIQAH